MTIENWDSIRTALAVARAGTVSGAAARLGVHHATVIRHIDALEEQMGTRLFQRHTRGYALTEAGRKLEQSAAATEARLAQLAAEIGGMGTQIEGELTITALPGLEDQLQPAILGLLTAHPGLRLNYVSAARVLRLEAGEAQVAIRAGSKPSAPDYVVQPFGGMDFGLFAAQTYLDRHGPVTDLRQNRFVLPGEMADGAPFMRWLRANLGKVDTVLASDSDKMRMQAIRDGLGLGFAPVSSGAGLVQLLALPEWRSTLWLVTHVDLHRSPKVQAVVAALKATLG